jgi:hypothetical protein
MVAGPTMLSDALREDAVLVLMGQWTAPIGRDQRPAAEAALEAWRDGTWPAGLLAHYCLLGEDGRTVLHYQQWSVDFDGADSRRQRDWINSVFTAPAARLRTTTQQFPGVTGIAVDRFSVTGA